MVYLKFFFLKLLSLYFNTIIYKKFQENHTIFILFLGKYLLQDFIQDYCNKTVIEHVTARKYRAQRVNRSKNRL